MVVTPSSNVVHMYILIFKFDSRPKQSYREIFHLKYIVHKSNIYIDTYDNTYVCTPTGLSQLKILKGRTAFCFMHIVKKFKTSNQYRMAM